MRIEQVKAEAKARYGVEITDEQAAEWLKKHTDGKLTDDELDNVAGGVCDNYCPTCGDTTTWNFYQKGADYYRVCKYCGYRKYNS